MVRAQARSPTLRDGRRCVISAWSRGRDECAAADGRLDPPSKMASAAAANGSCRTIRLHGKTLTAGPTAAPTASARRSSPEIAQKSSQCAGTRDSKSLAVLSALGPEDMVRTPIHLPTMLSYARTTLPMASIQQPSYFADATGRDKWEIASNNSFPELNDFALKLTNILVTRSSFVDILDLFYHLMVNVVACNVFGPRSGSLDDLPR
ncbi:hypothetical protein PsYK624_122590 [Phanerochaete sordida]|uniref:Uncharacterized protein n=1 Tax=Phanerochaete sordida TaxID=48140 RepID=A0A9P3GJE0_9APHY|nr:hypothetical protein PsYK624_122590 [Phanerochaete sordida]